MDVAALRDAQVLECRVLLQLLRNGVVVCVPGEPVGPEVVVPDAERAAHGGGGLHGALVQDVKVVRLARDAGL